MKVEQIQSAQIKIRPGHWVLFFTLLGFGLRLQRLSFQPLWGDEGWSIYFATQSLGELVSLTANDIHPPLYYVLLKFWFSIIGVGAEEARFLSVAIGTMLIPVMFVAGRGLFNARVGLVAAAITAVMPLAIYYSQEVRMYGLVTVLGAASTYFLIKAEAALMQSPSPMPSSFGIQGRTAPPQSPPKGGKKSSLSQRERAGVRATESTSPQNQAHRIDLSALEPLGGWEGHQKLQLFTRSPLNLFGEGRGRYTNSEWAYILTTAAALYTMYYAVFILVFQALYLLVNRVRHLYRPNPGAILTIFRPFLLVGLLYLPWVVYATPRLVSYIDNKRNVEGYLSLPLFRFVGDHLVAFSLGHIPLPFREYSWAALLIVTIALLGMIFTLRSKYQSRLLLFLYLFVPLGLGYLINLFYPFTPRFFERTLLLAAPAFWLFIAVGLAWLWDRQRFAASLIAGLALLVTLTSLFTFYTWPRYPEEDYRSLLADIAAQATTDDTVLASYQWQLGLYRAYLPQPRPQLFEVPGWGRDWSSEAAENSRLEADLSAIFARSPRLWFPAYQASGHIWEDAAEEVIAELGYPAVLEWYNPQTKLTLAGSAQNPVEEGPGANFGGRLALLEATVADKPFEAGRDIIPVKLIWQKQKNLGSEHRVSLRLVDAAGRTWTTRDSAPQAGHTFFTDLAVGDTLTDRHGLLTPAGAPPGLYRLLLSVRQVSDAHPLDLLDATGQPAGAELLLADIELVAPDPPVGAAALPVQTPVKANFDQRIELVGYSLGAAPFKSGEALPLTLFWRALAGDLDPLTVLIELRDAQGQVVVSQQQPPIWPASEWRRGTILRDPHDLLLPPTLPPGEYQVVISLLNAANKRLTVNQTDHLRLGAIVTEDRPRLFEPPAPAANFAVNFDHQAKLVGFDLPKTRVSPGDVLPVTLYWQALATFDRNLKVFVHLVDEEGQIVAQQDQIPGGGRFPTTGWLPDEYIVDAYTLSISADLPPSAQPYFLRLGFYDERDFSRLPVAGADDNQVILKSWPISIE